MAHARCPVGLTHSAHTVVRMVNILSNPVAHPSMQRSVSQSFPSFLANLRSIFLSVWLNCSIPAHPSEGGKNWYEWIKYAEIGTPLLRVAM